MRLSLRPTVLASAVALLAATALLGVGRAKAAQPPIDFPAGTACDFELLVTVAGNGNQHTRTFSLPTVPSASSAPVPAQISSSAARTATRR